MPKYHVVFHSVYEYDIEAQTQLEAHEKGWEELDKDLNAEYPDFDCCECREVA